MATMASAQSQTADTQGAPSYEMETLVVTAHRTPIEEIQAGSAVSQVDRELIDRRQTILLSDLLNDLPGVAVSRLGAPGGQTQLRIRGAEANQVLVLIDGVKANDPAGSDEFDFSTLTAADIEQMELVRGPQSALWGSEAVAGVLNITTRRAEKGTRATGFIEGGSFDTLYTGARLETGGERGGVAGSLSWLESAGVSSAAAGTEDDGMDNLTAGVNGDWNPSEISRLSFSARYTDASNEYDGVSFVTGLPEDADLESRSARLLLAGGGGVTVLDGRWDHDLRLTWLDSERREFRDGIEDSDTAADKLGAYYQSTLRLAPARQQFILGVDYEEERFETGGSNPAQRQRRDNLGLVLEYLAEPLTGLNVSASVRRDDNSDFRDVTTYRFTSSYLLTETTRVRASYGTGQKAPTFIELYGYFPDSFLGNPDLEPEFSRGFDLGVRQTLLDGRGAIEIGYFNERLEDEITTTFDLESGLGSVANLDGVSRRKGAELAFAAEVLSGLDTALSYTYTDSRQPDHSREIRRPRHMAAANVDYRWFRDRAGLNLNLSYTGSQRDTVFLPPSYLPETVVLDDYVLVNLTGSFAVSERFEIYLRAENLFDEDYVNVVGYGTPGRSIHAGFRIRSR
jgi:vitamin B12 transporter